MIRKSNYQTMSWLNDLYRRELLELDPPYQRRSVWNQAYKDYFVDSVINNYPCPAIFLFEQISPDGVATYKVVDGKQRLITLFDFCRDAFPVYPDASITALREKKFSEFSDEQKLGVWRYQFAVEYIPSEDERLITEIFNRINKNVARLSRQELRHAKYGGSFMSAVEALSDWMARNLPENFPNIALQSRKQMRDSEFVGNLLLLLEDGPRSYSQDQLDEAYSQRDFEWLDETQTTERFQAIIAYISELVKSDQTGLFVRSRMRNQADFYGLVGALSRVMDGGLPSKEDALERLVSFADFVDDDVQRPSFAPADSYYAAARSASNDIGPRTSRINTLELVTKGDLVPTRKVPAHQS